MIDPIHIPIFPEPPGILIPGERKFAPKRLVAVFDVTAVDTAFEYKCEKCVFTLLGRTAVPPKYVLRVLSDHYELKHLNEGGI